LVAIMIATVLFLDYRYHRLPPLPKPLPCAKWRAKDGEVAPWLQSLSVSSQVFARSSSRRDGRRRDRGPYVSIAFISFNLYLLYAAPLRHVTSCCINRPHPASRIGMLM
jgi:hypothetical protein